MDATATLRIAPLLTALVTLLGLAACSTAGTAPSPSADPSAQPTFGVAPIVTDVCATVDMALVNAFFGGTAPIGSNHPGVIAPVGAPQRVCSFGRPPDPVLWIGIASIPMVAAVPGPAEAMRNYQAPDYPDSETITGVGDLAVYEPFGTVLFAVKGSGLRYYGITIRADDPTPGRKVLGGVSQADLVKLANECLAHV